MRHITPGYADNVTLLRDNINTTNKSTKRLIDASKEVGLEINAGNVIGFHLGDYEKCRILGCYVVWLL
jgi:hypothetical protein